MRKWSSILVIWKKLTEKVALLLSTLSVPNQGKAEWPSVVILQLSTNLKRFTRRAIIQHQSAKNKQRSYIRRLSKKLKWTKMNQLLPPTLSPKTTQGPKVSLKIKLTLLFWTSLCQKWLKNRNMGEGKVGLLRRSRILMEKWYLPRDLLAVKKGRKLSSEKVSLLHKRKSLCRCRLVPKSNQRRLEEVEKVASKDHLSSKWKTKSRKNLWESQNLKWWAVEALMGLSLRTETLFTCLRSKITRPKKTMTLMKTVLTTFLEVNKTWLLARKWRKNWASKTLKRKKRLQVRVEREEVRAFSRKVSFWSQVTIKGINQWNNCQ